MLIDYLSQIFTDAIQTSIHEHGLFSKLQRP